MTSYDGIIRIRLKGRSKTSSQLFIAPLYLLLVILYTHKKRFAIAIWKKTIIIYTLPCIKICHTVFWEIKIQTKKVSTLRPLPLGLRFRFWILSLRTHPCGFVLVRFAHVARREFQHPCHPLFYIYCFYNFFNFLKNFLVVFFDLFIHFCRSCGNCLSALQHV